MISLVIMLCHLTALWKVSFEILIEDYQEYGTHLTKSARSHFSTLSTVIAFIFVVTKVPNVIISDRFTHIHNCIFVDFFPVISSAKLLYL